MVPIALALDKGPMGRFPVLQAVHFVLTSDRQAVFFLYDKATGWPGLF